MVNREAYPTDLDCYVGAYLVEALEKVLLRGQMGKGYQSGSKDLP